MGGRQDQFAQNVLRSYGGYTQVLESKALRASVQHEVLQQPMGHPDFAGLEIGETGHCDAAVAFIDLTNFTGRTFWDEPASVVALAQAVLTQVIEIVVEVGGHVLGLRGDGVFVCFGGPRQHEPRAQSAVAIGACAFALDATQSALNGLLRLHGLEPIQMRAGADYGRLDFVRTGTNTASEVNVIGFAANFAAKCEKYARSWEVVVGENMAEQITAPGILTLHPESPKEYQRDYRRRSYSFYKVNWRSFLPHMDGIAYQLAGSSTSSIRVR